MSGPAKPGLSHFDDRGQAHMVDVSGKPVSDRVAVAVGAAALETLEHGLGFVRGFVTDEHIRPTGQAPAAFWKALESSAATAPDEALMGTHHWAVLHFKRGGPRAAVTPIAALPATDIGFDAPPAAATVRARARATTRS